MSRKIHPDRLPEDDLNLYDLDDFAGIEEREEERRPQKREPDLPRCVNCPDRFVIPDGYNGWIHEDNYLYSCETDPKARKRSTYFAAARIT